MSKQCTPALVLMKNQRAALGLVAPPIDMETNDNGSWNMFAQFFSLGQITDMSRTILKPTVIVTQGIVVCTIEYSPVSMASQHHIQSPPDCQVNVFLQNVTIGCAAIYTAMTHINQYDWFGKSMPEIPVIWQFRSKCGCGK
ncbi:hypothetical protein D3C78_1436230 [compost metagenome]